MSARRARTIDARDAILGAVLLLVSLVLMILRFNGGIDSLRQGGLFLLSTVEQPLSTVRVYRQAVRTNEFLQRQNVLLQDELSRLRSAEEQNRILRDLLDFRGESSFDLVPVRVVAKELHEINNFLSLNRGSRVGVFESMPVVHPDGLIGHVTLVSPNYAQVMPYSHSLFRVSARVQASRASGIVSWDPSDPTALRMDFIPQTIAIEVGQVVETSGNSLQYPPGIPIGTVDSVRQSADYDTWEVRVTPYVNLNQLAEAFVVSYRPDPELDSLNRLGAVTP